MTAATNHASYPGDDDLINRIRGLSEHESDTAFSLFVPTHRTHPENQGDRIRLKNAIDDAADALESRGHGSREVDEMLQPLREHLDDRSFWEHRDLGYAAFGGSDVEVTEMDLRNPTEAVVRVGRRFHVRPLLAEIDMDPTPLLVLSRGHVRLYAVGERSAAVIEADLPESLEDENWFVDRESRLQRRPTSTDGAGEGGFHGHDPADQTAEDERRYLRAIADELNSQMARTAGPVIIADSDGLGSMLARMLDVNSVEHPAIAPDTDPALIADIVRPTIGEIVEQRREIRRETLAGALGQQRTVNDLGDALEAAAAGRLGSLAMMPHGQRRPGTFDETTFTLDLSDDGGDLADRLIGLTLSNGGTVAPLDEPVGDRWFVAVARYDD
jgi:hypothetical protein